MEQGEEARGAKAEVGTTEGIGGTPVKRKEVSGRRTTRSEQPRVTILAFRCTLEDRKADHDVAIRYARGSLYTFLCAHEEEMLS